MVVDPTRAKELYERLATSQKKILMYRGANHDLYSIFTVSEKICKASECSSKVLEDIAEWIGEINKSKS